MGKHCEHDHQPEHNGVIRKAYKTVNTGQNSPWNNSIRAFQNLRQYL